MVTKRIPVRLSAEMLKELSNICKELDITMSQAIRLGLDNMLAQQERPDCQKVEVNMPLETSKLSLWDRSIGQLVYWSMSL